MAKAKTTKKTTTKRRKSRASGDIMGTVMNAALMAAGIVAGNMIATKLPIADGRVRSAALLVGGAFLGKFMPGQMAPVALGVSAGGALGLAQQLFPQLAQATAVNGHIGRISPAQVKLLQDAVNKSVKGPTIVGPTIVGDDGDGFMYV